MKIYQISTLQALALGYSRSVVTVKELLEHGDLPAAFLHISSVRPSNDSL